MTAFEQEWKTIVSVTVKHGAMEPKYQCCNTRDTGWVCGRCMKGILGHWIRRGQRCDVCRSYIDEITECTHQEWCYDSF